MIGVRLPSRVVRTDIMRCLIVVAAGAVAATAGWGGFGIQGASKSKSSAAQEDPFLAEDLQAPAADEIPELPEPPAPAPKKKPKKSKRPSTTPEPAPKSDFSEFPPDVDLTLPDEPTADQPATPARAASADDLQIPVLKVPRVNRDIKQTALPRLDEAADLAEVPELIGQPATRPKMPTLKNTPIGDNPGWKSADGEAEIDRPVGGQKGPPKSKLDGPLAEQARLEKSPELEELEEPLAGIVIEGNKAKKTEEIMKLIKSRVGRQFDPKVAKEDVKTLVSKRWFYNVEIRIAKAKQGPVLVFRVTEKPLLEKITFVGNKKIKVKELTGLVDQCNLKVDGGYEVGQNREAAQRILANYREKGYMYATVELEKGDSRDDREVIFKIVEGPKVVVKTITFKGNKDFTSAVLKTQIKTKTLILWWFGGKYDPTSIQEDMNSLRQYYQDLGYFDMQISHRELRSEDKSKVTFEYTIDEGVRYKVRDILFVGNQVIPTEKLSENMKVRPGDFVAERFVNVDREKVVTQYGELGRIFAKVVRRYRSYEEPGFVDLIYEINEDRPWRIGRINVHIAGDHPHTKENAVLTKLTFKPGELASMAKIEKSKQRLKNAQIFAGSRPGAQQGPQGGMPPSIDVRPSDMRITPRNELNLARGQDDETETPVRAPQKPAAAGEFSVARGQNPGNNLYDNLPESDVQDSPPGEGYLQPEDRPGWLDVEVGVSETQTGSINMGVSVNSNAGLMGSVTLQENNFDLFKPPRTFQEILDGVAWRGGGQQFRVEAMPGLQLSRYLISWRDPYFLDQNISLGVSGSYFTRVIPNQWWEKRAGGRVTVGHQFTPITSGSITLRGENVQILNPAIPVPPDVQAVLGNTFLSTVKGTLVHDTRDNAFLPGRGHYIQLDYEQGFGNFVYPKVDVEAKQYFLVHERPDGGNRQVISVVGQFGYIGNQGPVYERYFAGGFSSFRGFRFYGVTPRVDGVGIGGQFQGLGTVEYLQPITADNTFQVVFFTDFGSVDSKVTFDHYRQTVGAGIRLSVPMMGPMPIAIDVAFPVLDQPQDYRQVVSFTMGLLK